VGFHQDHERKPHAAGDRDGWRWKHDHQRKRDGHAGQHDQGHHAADSDGYGAGERAKVSGVVTVSANATDNVSVASVQFQLDGANVGAADAASPFTYSWDTTKATNARIPCGPLLRRRWKQYRECRNNGDGEQYTDRYTPPTVSISAPAGAATVSGAVSVAANAADNVGRSQRAIPGG